MKIINIGVRLCLEGTGKAGAGLGVFLMVRRERPSLNVGCLASDLEALLHVKNHHAITNHTELFFFEKVHGECMALSWMQFK